MDYSSSSLLYRNVFRCNAILNKELIMKERLYLPLDNGRLLVERTAEGDLIARKAGEVYRNLNGDDLIYWLCFELCESRKREKELQAQLLKINSSEIDRILEKGFLP